MGSVRVMSWDGTTATELSIRQWDGLRETGLALGTPGADVVAPGSLFDAVFPWPTYAAHRGGDPGPANTMPAYRGSYATRPNTWAEADMRVLADGETVVLCHDPTIDAAVSTNSPITTGAVDSLTPAQWSTILMDAKDWSPAPDAPAAFLSDLIDAYGPGGTDGYRLLLLEIKRQAVAQPCIDAILAGGIGDRTIVNSYDLGYVQQAITAGLEGMHDTDDPNFPLLQSMGVKHVGVNESVVTAAMCEQAHNHGIRVWVYLINSTGERDSMLALGVDGMHTDKPELIAPAP